MSTNTIPSPPPPPPPPPPKPASHPTPPSRPSTKQSALATAFTATLAARAESDRATKALLRTYSPSYFFFYGSLTEPEVLRAVLSLPASTALEAWPARLRALSASPAVNTAVAAAAAAGPETSARAEEGKAGGGWRMKRMGVYPVLIPGASTGNDDDDSGGDGGGGGGGPEVRGAVCWIETAEQFGRLAAYETAAYTVQGCDVEVLDGGEGEGEMLIRCRTFCWAGDPESAELSEGAFDAERYRRNFKEAVVGKAGGGQLEDDGWGRGG